MAQAPAGEVNDRDSLLLRCDPLVLEDDADASSPSLVDHPATAHLQRLFHRGERVFLIPTVRASGWIWPRHGITPPVASRRRVALTLSFSRSTPAGILGWLVEMGQKAVPLSQGTRLHSADTGDVVFIALDRLEKPVPTRGDHVTAHVVRWYPVFLSLIAVACVARLILVAARGGAVLTLPATVALLFVLAIVASRLAFLAVLDASAWKANQMFHLFPIAPLAAIVPVIVFALARPRLAPGSQPVEGRRDAD
jgi:hypothetical protein